MAHASRTHMFCHIHTITCTVNYVCVHVGLHMSSPPLYMQGFILHAHTCADWNMRHHHLYFHRLAKARPSYTCTYTAAYQ